MEDTATDAVPRDQAQPDFRLVQPGGIGGSENRAECWGGVQAKPAWVVRALAACARWLTGLRRNASVGCRALSRPGPRTMLQERKNQGCRNEPGN
jgi:hypothetical protein